MGQYWKIVNLDKKEAINVSKLEETLFRDFGKRLLDLISHSRWLTAEELLEELSIPYNKNIEPKLGLLQPLPNEILDRIFSHIDKVQTAFRFGVSNKALLVIGMKRIHELLGARTWEGDRIMCVGDYQESNDIPKGLDLGEDYDNSDCSGNEDICPNIYGWAELSFPRPVKERLGSSRCKEEDKLACGLYRWGVEYQIGYTFAHMECLEVQFPSVVWNLSKNVYLRFDFIPNGFVDTNFPGADDLDNWEIVGQALLYQICWSSDNTGCFTSTMHHGNWAGDRFAISDMSVLEQRLKEEEGKWKDVSEEVIGPVMNLLKEECVPQSDYPIRIRRTRGYY